MGTSLLNNKLLLAPEVHEGKDYGIEADMFSFGVVLFELCNSSLPFNVSWEEKVDTN